MRTILIIGSTGKLGKALVNHFKNENCIEASRSLVRQNNQYHLDFADFQSILDFIADFQSISVDTLFVNSGIVCEKSFTKDGLDTMLMVNAFGPYYLVKEFLKTHPFCNIILTSSVSILRAKLDFSPKNYKEMYRNTKLLEHMLFRSLEEETPKRNIFYAHPGIVYSKLSSRLHCRLIQKWIRHFGNSLNNAVSGIIAAEHLHQDCCWVCPSRFFQLKGKSKLRKIKKDLSLNPKTKEYIGKIEKELEEKYGISCVGL